MRRIVTVTPNPGIDKTVRVPSLLRGEVLRISETRVDPGGKGLNVSRALALAGVATTAVIPVGGGPGQNLLDMAAAAGVDVVAVEIESDTRENLTIVEDDGTTTKINEPGPTLTHLEVAALLDAAGRGAEEAAWLVGCGSLAPGMPESFYADLVGWASRRGMATAIDTSGPALAAVIDAKPTLVTPNVAELAEVVGHDLPDLPAIVAAARTLCGRGVGSVLVTMGAEGAALVDGGRAITVRAAAVQPVSTVGAGDALLAGYLAAVIKGAAVDEALRQGVSYGTAAALLPGSAMPHPADVAALEQ